MKTEFSFNNSSDALIIYYIPPIPKVLLALFLQLLTLNSSVKIFKLIGKVLKKLCLPCHSKKTIFTFYTVLVSQFYLSSQLE